MRKLSLNKQRIAIIVGDGDLPVELVKRVKAIGVSFAIIKFEGVPSKNFINEDIIEAKFENISELFDELKVRKFNSVICCGYMARPKLNYNKITIESRSMLAPIVKNFKLGDEAVFCSILELFEKSNLIPLSILDLVPKFFPVDEFLTHRKPIESDVFDAKRSEEILNIISSADLGQSLVVSAGICLAVETAPGTDAMLDFLSNFKLQDGSFSNNGVLYKAPKPRQNIYIDQPVIGFHTIEGVKRAGLNGIVIKNSKVIVLDLEKTIKVANDLGVFIWSKK